MGRQEQDQVDLVDADGLVTKQSAEIGDVAEKRNLRVVSLHRIADQPADQGFITESMMSAIAQAAPEAKQRVRDFLEGRAAKVSKQ